MLKKGEFIDKHFNDKLHFISREFDPVTKDPIIKMIIFGG